MSTNMYVLASDRPMLLLLLQVFARASKYSLFDPAKEMVSQIISLQDLYSSEIINQLGSSAAAGTPCLSQQRRW
jgi:hypothetical protein